VPQPDVVVAKVDAYNQAIARIAEREGAVLVDLHGASLKAREEGRDAALVSADGFHPSTAGHAAVAETFAEAARRAGV
jgi:lysophospholipase L1-like esterase